MDNETREAIERLTAKLVIIEAMLRTIVMENLMETDDPVATMRDYAGRIEQSLTTAIPGLAASRAAMLIQAEIAEQFAVIEKWLGQAGAR